MISSDDTVCCTSASMCEETSTVRPSRASSRRKPRSHLMPSGSRPFAGSSSTSTPGSPSSVYARLRRWRMPSENPPTLRPATSASPTSPSTSSTRLDGSPAACAYTFRWFAAVRPGWKLDASSAAPTVCSGLVRSA